MSRKFYKNDSNSFLNNLDHGQAATDENRWVFEVAWEAANKVGGIYTVIRSKSFISTEELGDQYCLIGPYKEYCARTEVELTPLINPKVNKAVDKLNKDGYKIYTGRWLVDGNPQIVLMDLASKSSKLDEYKRELWDECHIGIPHLDIECNDAVVFGFMVMELIKAFYEVANDGIPARIVAHFHEWQTGVGLMMLRMHKVDVGLVFTAHATLLGRYLCAANLDFYNNLQHFNVDEEAGKRQIYHRYSMERSAVHLAHIFTTVSEITGLEAEHLLKRKPDIITPNGLNVKKFSALHEFQNLHATSKEKIHEFVRGHFYGHYDFDLDNTLYFFTAGRYEFSNKGADILIEALARLNYLLKSKNPSVTVVVFLIFPTQTNNYNVESLRGHAVTKSLRDTIDRIQQNIGHRLYDICLRGDLPNAGALLKIEEQNQLKRCLFSLQRNGLPPITTHNVTDSANDPVLQALRRCRLFNAVQDRVKVIFHPEFLSSANPLFGIDYEEFVRGCHLGIFPSYYEPWGYTPAECTIMGIPNVTTNLSGFGCFMQKHVDDLLSYGIYVIDRRYMSLDDSINQLTHHLFEFCKLNRRQRIIQRNRTERLSDMFDWRILEVKYCEARMRALKLIFPEIDVTNYDYNIMINFRYPKPYSEPSSPYSSRGATPTPGSHASDVEDDVDDETELEELQINERIHQITI